MKKTVTIVLIVIAALAACGCAVLFIIGASHLIYNRNLISATAVQPAPDLTEQGAPLPTDELTLTPIDSHQILSAQEMLQILNNTEVPISNYYDLASRLLGKNNISLTLPAPTTPLKVNSRQQFWVTNTDSHETFKVDAYLAYITDHLYLWIQNGVNANQTDVKKLAETFEDHIYPTDREFFGSEWTPGVDNDPHLYILLAGDLGKDLAGYYSSSDEYNPEVHEYSNAHEMFLLNADNIRLDDEFTYGVLAHEFQHMIHWYRDLNEETWLNEGFSELAALLNGYDVGGFDQSYTTDPDLQLTDWSSGVGDNSAHYGASFLFVSYFLDRFGENATKAVVAAPENGMNSITKVLADLHKTDAATGKALTADDVFSDWVVTNYLNDPSVEDGRYAYHKYTSFDPVNPTTEISNCPLENTTASVYQYGADYLQITCRGDYTFHFAGQPLVRILNVDASSGNYAVWSNKGDESDMTLTRSFDFSSIQGSLSLNYALWYDLEKDYDDAYVEISTDGQHWDLLRTPDSTDSDLSGNSFGWAYNGTSNGWIEESVDLSAYAGQKVQIRFEYITDAAVNGEGLLVDDIRIPEINYTEGFESGDGGWQYAGFVRTNNRLPQTYRLNLILNDHGQVRVTPLIVSPEGTIDVPLQLKNGQTAVITISGTSPYTRQPAAYTYSIR